MKMNSNKKSRITAAEIFHDELINSKKSVFDKLYSLHRRAPNYYYWTSSPIGFCLRKKVQPRSTYRNGSQYRKHKQETKKHIKVHCEQYSIVYYIKKVRNILDKAYK